MCSPAASVAVLDEPAVTLHPSLQRQRGAYPLDADPRFVMITHSAELLPLADTTEVRLILLDRDGTSATRAWLVDPAFRAAGRAWSKQHAWESDLISVWRGCHRGRRTDWRAVERMS